jgi:hypothetical protein
MPTIILQAAGMKWLKPFFNGGICDFRERLRLGYGWKGSRGSCNSYHIGIDLESLAKHCFSDCRVNSIAWQLGNNAALRPVPTDLISVISVTFL